MPFKNITRAGADYYKPCCRYTIQTNEEEFMFETIHDAFVSKKFDDIRSSMNNGEELSGCSKCYQEEAAGLQSLRTRKNKLFNNSTSVELSSIELAFSRKCNLRCLMCSSEESTKWEELVVQNEGIQKLTRYKIQPPLLDNINLLDGVDFSLIKQIKIVGGEPFIEEKFLDFLEKCESFDIDIEISTNATFFPKKYISILGKFKRVDIALSIDGIGKVNDYIRRPSQWDNVEHVSLQWLAASKNMPNLHVRVFSTVSIYNVLSINDLIYWCNTNDLFHKVTLLQRPDYLNIANLPDAHKAYVEQQTDDPLILEGLKNQMSLLDDFKKYTRLMDEHDNTSIYDISEILGRLVYE